MQGVIDLNKVSVHLDGHEVIKDLTASIPSGKIIGLLGPNGAGKTTLIRAIVGRQRIYHGTITVMGLPAGSPRLREKIGYMTQAPSVYTDATVRENLRYFAAMTGQPKARIDEVIEEVELQDKADTLVGRLSGGQRSRVSLATAFINKPQLLVLDEPTVGLDPVLRQRLWRLFKRFVAGGRTLLISSHVMDEATRCEELLLMREGQMLAQGTPDQICVQTHTTNIEDGFITLVQQKGAV